MPAQGAGIFDQIDPHEPLWGSVPNRDAGNVGALQRLAHRLGLIAVEAGEAGPEQLPFALGDDRFGEGLGLGKQVAGLAARGFDPGARTAGS